MQRTKWLAAPQLVDQIVELCAEGINDALELVEELGALVDLLHLDCEEVYERRVLRFLHQRDHVAAQRILVLVEPSHSVIGHVARIVLADEAVARARVLRDPLDQRARLLSDGKGSQLVPDRFPLLFGRRLCKTLLRVVQLLSESRVRTLGDDTLIEE